MSEIGNLRETPPWEWPTSAAEKFRKTLLNKSAPPSDRLIAAELAGDATVVDDVLAKALMKVAGDGGEPEELRSKAVISFGPALELAFTNGFDDPNELDMVPISEEMFHGIQDFLRNLCVGESGAGNKLRRKSLEASVRAPQDWQREAIQKAWSSGDRDWQLTGAFCMRYVRGFADQILEALQSKDNEIRAEAVSAAGTWEMEAAWPVVQEILDSRHAPKDLLIAAIEATGAIRKDEARDLLQRFKKSRDRDVAEAADEAIEMADIALNFDDEEFDEEDEDEDDWVN